jgi:hypothetical protein
MDSHDVEQTIDPVIDFKNSREDGLKVNIKHGSLGYSAHKN